MRDGSEHGTQRLRSAVSAEGARRAAAGAKRDKQSKRGKGLPLAGNTESLEVGKAREKGQAVCCKSWQGGWILPG